MCVRVFSTRRFPINIQHKLDENGDENSTIRVCVYIFVSYVFDSISRVPRMNYENVIEIKKKEVETVKKHYRADATTSRQ